MYIKDGYFSLVALNFADTTALDQSIAADLQRNHITTSSRSCPTASAQPARRQVLTRSGDTSRRREQPGRLHRDDRETGRLADKRHPPSRLVPPPPPDDDEKYSYIQRNLPYLTTILVIGAGCLIFSQLRFEAHDLALWPFMVFTATYVIYQVISLPVNFTGAGFDLAAHQARIRAWHPASYPDVDIYLPICGEPIEMLRNTWNAVPGLIADYPGRTTALRPGRRAVRRSPLDGGVLRLLLHPPARLARWQEERQPAVRLRPAPALSTWSSWTPTSRRAATSSPRRFPTWMIRRSRSCRRPSSSGAAPRRRGSSTPQERSRRCSTGRSRWPATGSDAAVCVGTSAVYRRAALEPYGGPTLIPYAEDVHTGLDVRRAGWSMIYMPIVLSTGICPDNLDSFVRQQYRWCSGNVGIVFSRRLWAVPMSFPARLTYISGFFYYAFTGLLTFFGPIIPIVMLAFLPGQIRLRNFIILLPAMLTGFVLYPLWHRARYGPSVWPLGIARGWAHVFAIWDGAWGKTMGWHPTRTPGSSLRRFRIGVTWWSGGMAVLWLALAIWRTVTMAPCSSRSCCSSPCSISPW